MANFARHFCLRQNRASRWIREIGYFCDYGIGSLEIRPYGFRAQFNRPVPLCPPIVVATYTFTLLLLLLLLFLESIGFIVLSSGDDTRLQ